MLNSSGVEPIYTLTNGLTNIQKSDLYSEVALAKSNPKKNSLFLGMGLTLFSPDYALIGGLKLTVRSYILLCR